MGVTTCERSNRHWRDPDPKVRPTTHESEFTFLRYRDTTWTRIVGYGLRSVAGPEALDLAYAIKVGWLPAPQGARRIDLPAAGSHGEIMAIFLPKLGSGDPIRIAMHKPSDNEGNWFALGKLGVNSRRKFLTQRFLKG